MAHKSRGSYIVGISFCKKCGVRISGDGLCPKCFKSALKKRIQEIDKTLGKQKEEK